MYRIGNDYEVAVIGAGVAGLSAALMLGRARIGTLLVGPDDAGAWDGESHNMLTNDGATKSDILRRGAAEVARYPSVERRPDHVTGIEKDAFGYELSLGSETVEARRLVIATGPGWRPDAVKIAGLAARLGQDVFTCPYCHGYEVADRRVALIGTQPNDGQFLKLLSNWSGDLSYIDHDGASADSVASELAAYSTGGAHSGRVAAVEGDPGAPVAVLEDGTRIAADALFLSEVPGATDSPLLDALGIERGLHPQTGKPMRKTDAAGRTDLGDVFVVGDVRTGFSTLAGAANEGMGAGFMLANDVIEARLAEKGVPIRAAA